MKRPRSALQIALAQTAAREALIDASLAAAKRSERWNRPAVDVAQIVADLQALYPSRVVRNSGQRKFCFKTRDVGKISLVVAQYLFGRYPVARHLESIWHETPGALPPSRPRGVNPNAPAALTRSVIRRRRDWYVIAAGGGSLYREHTHHFMSKKETHFFLTVPFALGFDEAIAFALARSHTDDLGLCTRLGRSKLAQRSTIIDAGTPARARAAAQFWKEAIRFFVANPAPINEVNDLVDFLDHAREENAAYSLKGRTLASVTAAMRHWHRNLHRIKRMGNHEWAGARLPDREYIKIEGGDGKASDWTFTQVASSKELAEEGNEMHHCVYTYQAQCISGRTSIWSLRWRHTGAGASYKRRITFEIDNDARRIVQVRGYANRLADGDEAAIIGRWAAENGVSYRG